MRVSVLLLLVPPLAAIKARLLFGEHLATVLLVGFAFALALALVLVGVPVSRMKAHARGDRRAVPMVGVL